MNEERITHPRLRRGPRGRTRAEQRDESEAGFPERFWLKVDKNHPSGCWVWTAGKSPLGYGRIQGWRASVSSPRNKRKVLLAHRVSWEFHHGPVPDGLEVLHSCDNPPCVNPHVGHLHLGTHADNMRESGERGRVRNGVRLIGEENNKAKLTAGYVREIKARYAFGCITMRQLASQYGVTFTPIQRVLSGKTWRHIS